MSYQKLLHELAPGLSPAADRERRSPGYLRRTVASFGMAGEFTAREAK
jgi:hypothetical protein